jgi:uncharacterized membrane protein YjgN (DUF898 family)
MWFSQRLINIISSISNVLFVTITGDKFGIYVPICQLFILHIVICFYILFFSLENVIDELLKKLGEYLLITDVKFITSGTIRYDIIKTSY